MHQRKLKVMSRKEMQENRKSERLAAQEQRKLVRSAKKLFEEDLEEDLDDIRRKKAAAWQYLTEANGNDQSGYSIDNSKEAS